MGSFNEICAISGFNIQWKDKVKVVFLAGNEMVQWSQRPWRKIDFERGHYVYDQWFLRTPPIDGVYDDYGRCTFKRTPIVRLIEEMFAEDVLEEPFGFNQYHDLPTPLNPKIDQLFEISFKGRLRVGDLFFEEKSSPAGFPLWWEVRDLLKKAKLKIMSMKGDSEPSEGYNVQQVREGVVLVHYNSYKDTTEKMKKAEGVILNHYDCRIVKDGGDKCGLLVVPKGAFEDQSMFLPAFMNKLKDDIERYPNEFAHYFGAKKMPVVAVMIRQDVWELYRDTKWECGWCPTKNSVDLIKGEIKSALSEMERDKFGFDYTTEKLRHVLGYQSCRPMAASLPQHLKHLTTMGLTDKQMEDALTVFAETTRVETTMQQLHQCWSPPLMAGQDAEWDLWDRINKGLGNIIQETRKRWEEESGVDGEE